MSNSPSIPQEIAEAVEAGRVWEPEEIGHLRASRALGLEDTVEVLRDYFELFTASDAKDLPHNLIALVRLMTDRLNWLAEAGKLGDAPRHFETWPINYAPDVGIGASKWEAAKSLYRQLGCGRAGFVSRDAWRGDYKQDWTALVMDALKAAQLAKHRVPWVDERKAKAILRHHIEVTHRATTVVCDYYLCDDGQVIVWPGWAEDCRDTPDTLTRDNWKQFLPVIRELVRLYLLADESQMRKLQVRAAGVVKSDKWDAAVFNDGVMKATKDALESVANKSR